MIMNDKTTFLSNGILFVIKKEINFFEIHATTLKTKLQNKTFIII